MSKERLTYIVLGIFLILSGLVGFISGLGDISVVINLLAIASGILILVSSPGISIFIGWIIAAIYLILLGLMGVTDFSFGGSGIVMAILALAAGVILLIRAPGFRHHVGFLLFCAWLILVGLTGLVSLGEIGVVINIIVIASGVLMILNE
jgi:hypothetical protein